jgi:hypothetical protein
MKREHGTSREAIMSEPIAGESKSWAELEQALSAALHELGNHLNQIALQAAVLERKLAEEFQPDVRVIRDQCRQAAAGLAALRQVRDRLQDGTG